MKRLANGLKRGKDGEWRRVVVGFDDETFAHIRALAFTKGVSFAEQVRVLTEIGLEEVKFNPDRPPNFPK